MHRPTKALCSVFYVLSLSAIPVRAAQQPERADGADGYECHRRILSQSAPDAPLSVQTAAQPLSDPDFARSLHLLGQHLRQVHSALVDWMVETTRLQGGAERVDTARAAAHSLIHALGVSQEILEVSGRNLAELRESGQSPGALHDLKNFFQLAQTALLRARLPFIPEAQRYRLWTQERSLVSRGLSSQELQSAFDSLAQAIAALNECFSLIDSLASPREAARPQFSPLDLARWLSRLRALYPQISMADQPHRAWTVSADPDRLLRAMTNLISNAQQAGAAESEITFSLAEAFHEWGPDADFGQTMDARALRQRSGPYLGFSVEDRAGGVAPDLLDSLFVRGVTQNAGSGGKGLGLSSVLADALEMGGFIDVHTTPQKGSRFTLWLPVSGVEGPSQAHTIATSGAQRQVVLIDDMETALRMMAELLRSMDMEVATFTSRRDAAAYIAQNADRVGVVVTDLATGAHDIPLTGLLEVLRPIAHARVVVVSGHAVDPLPAGVADAYRKPLDFVRFSQRLEQLLE